MKARTSCRPARRLQHRRLSVAAAMQPAAPPAGYTIEEKYTQKSPDGSVTIEQYVNKDTDEWKWQFWARWQNTFTPLDPEPALYPADFIFTNDLKWIVRVQLQQKKLRLPMRHGRRSSS